MFKEGLPGIVKDCIMPMEDFMTAREAVLREVEGLADESLDEVLEYIKRLKLARAIQRSETALASEQALARDWLSSEEDEAWRDL